MKPPFTLLLPPKRWHATAAVIFALLLSASSLFGANPVRVHIPGNAFKPQLSPDVAVKDVADGRQFRHTGGDIVKLAGAIALPSGSPKNAKIQKLVVRFHTVRDGPDLVSVNLRSGESTVFHLETRIDGDYTSKEVSLPKAVANAWVFEKDPIGVASGAVLLLEVQFHGGFEGAKPGEFILTAVDLYLQGKADTLPTQEGKKGTPSAAVLNEPGVIYGVSANNDLLWFRHDGRGDGSFKWAGDGKKVGSGWSFQHVFSGGDGVIYAITPEGDLLWYRHDGRSDGTFKWAEPAGKKVGSGWNFPHVFSGGDGIIYAITTDGDLLWYRHDGREDGSFKWAVPEGKKINSGWNFQHVFSAGAGVIYAITAEGDLLWFRHDSSFKWSASEGKKVGTGWNVEHAFAGREGIIYAVMPNGDLRWNRHEGRSDGTFQWAAPEGKQVGNGWVFKEIFSGDRFKL